MTTKDTKSLSALLSDVLSELEGHPNTARFEELYDSDDALASALNRLPDFEYPDVSYMNVRELREFYTRQLKQATN